MIEYVDIDRNSILSLYFPTEIVIDDIKYDSPAQAIEKGIDSLKVVTQFVQLNRDKFNKYKYGIFTGDFADDLNQVVPELFRPKYEGNTIGRYIYLVDSKNTENIPISLSKPVIRNIYDLKPINENVFQQISMIDKYEEYNVAKINGITIYIGKYGSFVLLPSEYIPEEEKIQNSTSKQEIITKFNQLINSFQVRLEEGSSIEIIPDENAENLATEIMKYLDLPKCKDYTFSMIFTLFNIYKPRSVLDLCTQCGDSVLSAIAFDTIEYIGFSTNTRYTDLSRLFDRDYSKFQIGKNFMEQNIPSDKQFDTVILSCSDISKEMIDKAWKHLQNGGFLFVLSRDYQDENILDYITSRNYANYYAMIKYQNSFIYVYQKVIALDMVSAKQIVDKPLIIKSYKYDEKTFYIIREDMNIGGTKQRIALNYLNDRKEKHIFYRGPVNGYAQVAIAYACKILGKQCHLILNQQYDKKKYIVTLIAMLFGAQIHEVPKEKDEKLDEQRTKRIIDQYQKDGGAYRIPLGLKLEENIDLYTKSQLSTLIDTFPIVRNLWMVSSSGLIYKALYRLLPNTHFNVVLVGHKNYDEFYKERTTIYEAPENFREPAKFPPPYPSESTYDAKLWQFVTKYGKDGDYILNIAGL